MGCCDGWEYEKEEIDGTCPECGTPTVDGDAYKGCHWSPVACEVCGDAPCDQSC